MNEKRSVENSGDANDSASLFELVQAAYKNRRTGLVRRSHRGVESERYFVVKGELYLPRDHPLSMSIERQLLGKSAANTAVAYETQPLEAETGAGIALQSGLRILVEILGDPRSVGFEYERGATEIPVDVVGPLPTAELLMEASVRGLDEFDLLRRLGGENSVWVAGPDELVESGPEIDPQQAFLLSRAEKKISVRELLRQAEIDRPQALSKLVRLASVGMIESGDGSQRTTPAHGPSDPRPRDSIVQRLDERVASDLERKPLDLDADEHRNKILEYLASFGERNFYELLGVDPQATPEDVHAAYSERARVTHPTHAEPLGLKGGAAPLRVLFETLTDAYLTLSDPDRRRSYQMKLGRDFNEALVGVSEEERQKEQIDQASRNFTIARSMIDREDFHSAIELLEQSVKSDPQAEYYTLLAQCQARNPMWLARSMQNFQRALDLDGESIEARQGLAKVLDAAGMTTAAEDQLNLLKTIDEEAAAEVSAAVAEKSGKKAGKGLLGRLFSSLRGSDTDASEPDPAP